MYRVRKEKKSHRPRAGRKDKFGKRVERMSNSAEMLKREMESAYRVLGEKAESGNIMDINQLHKAGIITEAEKIYLLEYNKQLYKRCTENKKGKDKP